MPQMFSAKIDPLISSQNPTYFSPIIKSGDITRDDKINKIDENAWVVSIALCGQAFTQRIQLSHLYDQNGRRLNIEIASTGHCSIHFPQRLQESVATNVFARKNRPIK